MNFIAGLLTYYWDGREQLTVDSHIVLEGQGNVIPAVMYPRVVDDLPKSHQRIAGQKADHDSSCIDQNVRQTLSELAGSNPFLQCPPVFPGFGISPD